jgi:hypothetical protein
MKAQRYRHLPPPRIEEVVTEYFKEYPPHSSKKFAEQAGLLDRYLLPRFGERWLSGVQTEEWFEMIEAAALERQADGINLHKSLKAFNNYAIRRKLRKVNPLAKTTPDSLSIRHLSSLNAGFHWRWTTRKEF